MGEHSVLGDTHPTAQLLGSPKSIFSQKYHLKLKTQNPRKYVVCWKEGKSKLHYTTAKYVMWASV